MLLTCFLLFFLGVGLKVLYIFFSWLGDPHRVKALPPQAIKAPLWFTLLCYGGSLAVVVTWGLADFESACILFTLLFGGILLLISIYKYRIKS